MSIIENMTATAPDGTTQTVGKLDCSTEFAVLTLENKSADSYILSGFIRSEGNGSFYVEGVKTLPTSPTWQSFSIVVPANVSQLKITFENDIYYIYKWLFEQGNKQTSWAPSPEDIESRMTTAESSIKQNAEQIELKVSKDGIISSINQSAEQVTISASKINLNGVVTANKNFQIDEEGSSTAKNMNILDTLNIKPDDTDTFCEVLQAIDTDDFPSGVVMSDDFGFVSSIASGLFVLIFGEGLSGIKIPVPIKVLDTISADSTITAKNFNSNGSIYGRKDLLMLGNIKAKNFERGTLEVVVENATINVTKEIPLSFTPTETTQCVLSLRTAGSPQPRYLNCWANYLQPNTETTPILQACLTAGGSSASTVPAGTYYIDYIAANV